MHKSVSSLDTSSEQLETKKKKKSTTYSSTKKFKILRDTANKVRTKFVY